MKNQPYFPAREGDQLPWFVNLQMKYGGYAATLEISTDRQAKLALVLAWLTWTWQTYMPLRRADALAATKWRDQLAYGTSDASTNTTPPQPMPISPTIGVAFFGMLTWLFEEIGRWKKAEGYTDTIGADLGLVGHAAIVHADPPALTAAPWRRTAWSWISTSTNTTACGSRASGRGKAASPSCPPTRAARMWTTAR
jgi:hypothetical protein